MRVPDVLRKFFSLTDSQQDRVIRVVNDMANLNAQLAGTEPEVCPKCHCADGFTKAGIEHIKHTGGKRTGNPYATKQIYRCRSCGKRFVYDSGTMTQNLKITQEEFVEICKDAILCVPMKKTAGRLNRSIQCVFENRHKFLCFLEKALGEETEKLGGTVEIDETYVLESQKGARSIKREVRRRGESSHYRGISHEQVCIVTSSDRNGHEVYKTAGTGRPSAEDIDEGFEDEIECKSEMYVDGSHIYDDLAKKTECDIRHLKGYASYNKVEHLNTVNCIHSMIKKIYAFYRGVASYYLDRYLALFVIKRRFLGMVDNEITELIVRKLKEVKYNVTREKLKHVYMTSF